MTRADVFAQLAARTFDILVIGGGIVGAGIARDAALRGLAVALVDQGDFAGGTSSNTSKLIHGGLRYLERGQLGLVRDSLRERQHWLRHAPGVVWPLPVWLPSYAGAGRPAWQLRVGLWLYDTLTMDAGLRRHRWLSADEACAAIPQLRRAHLQCAGQYTDGQMDDARLCIATVLDAVDHGAVCGNYVRVRALLRAHGTICGASLQDMRGTATMDVRATVVINATGPWADTLRALSCATARPRIAPTKGVHLLVPRVAEAGLLVQAPQDRRPVFLLPWNGHTLIGTTESSVETSLETLRTTRDEVDYLLAVARDVVPACTPTRDQVIATFVGARPLLTFRGHAARASREAAIEEDAAGMVSVMGGKYTTFRHMAERTVDWLQRRRRVTGTARSRTRVTPLLRALPDTEAWVQEASRAVGSDEVTRVVTRYGMRARDVLAWWIRAPALRQPVCVHHRATLAEVVVAVQQEQACTFTDILARRLRVAWSPCHGVDGIAPMLQAIQTHTAQMRTDGAQQVDAYRQWITENLACTRGV